MKTPGTPFTVKLQKRPASRFTLRVEAKSGGMYISSNLRLYSFVDAVGEANRRGKYTGRRHCVYFGDILLYEVKRGLTIVYAIPHDTVPQYVTALGETDYYTHLEAIYRHEQQTKITAQITQDTAPRTEIIP